MPERHVGVGIETTWNVLVAATEFTEALSEGVVKEAEFENLTTIRSNSVREAAQLTEQYPGPLELLGNFEDPNLLLYLFFGTVSTTGTGPQYTHTFPATGGTPGREGRSGTVEIKRDNDAQTWKYAGSKVESWQLAGAINQSPRLTFGIVGASETLGSPTTPTYPPFAPMLITGTTIKFDGSSNMTVQDFNINAQWPVDRPFGIGSKVFAKEPQDSDVLSVEATLTVLFDADALTEYNKFDGTTDINVQIEIISGALSMAVNLPRSRITAYPVNLSGRERLTGTITLQSLFNSVAEENLQVVLTNSRATVP